MLKQVVVSMSTALSLLACESSPSDVVHTFLKAARDGDLATLATVSVVGLPGESNDRAARGRRVQVSDIDAWWITRVTTPQMESFDLEERQLRLNAARAARDARLGETGEAHDAELERIQSRVERLRIEVEGEREAARKSVESWASVDEFGGNVESTIVEVLVRSPDGNWRYALTLKRYRLARAPDEDPMPSRWIVTAIEPSDR